MNKIKLSILALLFSGCTSVQVIPTYPVLPDELKKPCEPLTTIDEKTVQLADLMKVVITNYMKRHDCAQRLEAMQEWHEQNRKLFEKSNTK